MSYSIVLSNGLNVPLSVVVLGKTYNIASESSITVMGVINGTQVQLLTDTDVVVRFTNDENQNRLVELLGNNTPFFIVSAPGTYGVFNAGQIAVRGQVTLKSIIDRILFNPCNDGPEFPYSTLYSFPGDAFYGNNNPCEFRWFQEVLSMLNRLLQGKPESQRLAILNEAVVTEVPFQGLTPITLLEAAILQRSPSLVARLLTMGSDPNVSTEGIPLVNQVIDAIGYDFYNGNYPEDQAIVQLLLRAGANVYPGFPGTTFPGQGLYPYWGGNNFNGCNNGFCDY